MSLGTRLGPGHEEFVTSLPVGPPLGIFAVRQREKRMAVFHQRPGSGRPTKKRRLLKKEIMGGALSVFIVDRGSAFQKVFRHRQIYIAIPLLPQTASVQPLSATGT